MRQSLIPFAPLKRPPFRAIWTASFVSNLGTLIQGVGAAWLMTEITRSADMVALVQTAMSLPVMLFAIFGGAIADSFDRRRVMLGAQVFMLVAAASLTALAIAGMVGAWTILALTFLIGCGTAIFNPSWHASIGDLVPRDEIPAAVGLNSLGFNLSRSIGPAIGGAVVALVGATAAFGLNALSFIPIVVALVVWRPASTSMPVPRESIGAAISTGLRYLAMSPPVLSVLVRSFAFGFTSIVVVALLPVVSTNLLGGGAFTFGMLLSCYGLGAVVAAISSSLLRTVLNAENILRLAIGSFAASAGLCATGSVWLTALGLVLGGAGWVLGQSLFNVSVQLSTPRWVVGRAISAFQTAAFGGMAAGSWFWGVIGEGFGLQQALIAAAFAILVTMALGLFLRLPPDSGEKLMPSGQWREPSVALEIEPRSGPIHVEIHYRISPQNTAAFLRLMVRRRRVRRRDGAQGWTLLRDLHDPDRWIERYRTARWADYVRHNLRRTKVDAEIFEQLKSLHSGLEPPVVHRYLERPAGWSEPGIAGP